MVTFFYYPDPSLPFAHHDYPALCRRLIESAEANGHEVVHLTLEGGPDFGCRRVVVPGDKNRILLTRMRVYAALPAPAWLLDCDCVVLQPLPLIKSADLWLTWRPNMRQCYNTGVIHVASEAGRQMLRAAVYAYKGKASPWGLDQEMLLRQFTDFPPGIYDAGVGKLGVLDGDIWNYSPSLMRPDLGGRYIMHLKGERKGMELEAVSA